MPEPELAELTALVDELNESTGALASSVGEQMKVQVELRRDIAAVRGRLPEFVPKRRFRAVVVAVVVAGLVVAAITGMVVYLNHETTCGIRGVLVLARSTSERIPVPPNATAEQREQLETQRERSRIFYNEALGGLQILWPCDQEERIGPSRT